MNINLCNNCFAPLGSDGLCPKCGFDNAAFVPEPHHLPPETILHGRYLVGKALGEGGFGITYAGYDLMLKRKVAVKEYFPSGAVWRDLQKSLEVSCYTSQNIRETFSVGRQKCIQEAQSLARLDDIHGIVRILDFFPENNTTYLIMEFVEGSTLKDHTKRLSNLMTLPEITALLTPVIEALQTVHKRGFVHRDISPDNIMITQDGTAKLLDFGAVKSVSSGGSATQHPVVKRGFSPLELYSTEGLIGTWTDVYALSATVYYLLTGEVPDEPMDRLDNDRVANKLNTFLPPAQKEALCKGLAIQPKDRYQSIAELMTDLKNENADKIPQASAFENHSNFTFQSAPAGESSVVLQQMKARTKEAFIVLSVLAGLAIIIFLLTLYDDDFGGFFVPLLFLLLGWCVRYSYFRTYRNIKWLEKRGKANIGDDIIVQPDERLCCGGGAFFETKQKLLIPYADVAYVYQLIGNDDDPDPIFKNLIIRTCDGKLFDLSVSLKQFDQVLQSHRDKFSSGLLVGHTKENSKAYAAIRKRTKAEAALSAHETQSFDNATLYPAKKDIRNTMIMALHSEPINAFMQAVKKTGYIIEKKYFSHFLPLVLLLSLVLDVIMAFGEDRFEEWFYPAALIVLLQVYAMIKGIFVFKKTEASEKRLRLALLVSFAIQMIAFVVGNFVTYIDSSGIWSILGMITVLVCFFLLKISSSRKVFSIIYYVLILGVTFVMIVTFMNEL